MRGKEEEWVIKNINYGITPAYAGKREAQHAAEGVHGDHPRLCGEKAKDGTAKKAELGSPPPMRGKATAPAGMEIPTRITPAYAGKRPRFCWAALYRQDHPRLCGEKRPRSTIIVLGSGSPPPMRGKVLGCGHAVHARGITPAYAGKSYRRILACPIHRDHPRLCGEKLSQPNRL